MVGSSITAGPRSLGWGLPAIASALGLIAAMAGVPAEALAAERAQAKAGKGATSRAAAPSRATDGARPSPGTRIPEAETSDRDGDAAASDAQRAANLRALEDSDYTLERAGDDIRVTQGKARIPVFSARRWVRQEIVNGYAYDPEKPNLDFPPPFIHYDRSFKALSLVGPFLSLHDVERIHNPRAYVVETIKVIDLRAPSRTVRLTDFFAEKDILAAFLRDPVVKSQLAATPSRGAAPPRTLHALIERLYPTGAPGSGPGFRFQHGLIKSWAFHSVQGDQAVVRVAIKYQDSARAEHYRTIALTLPAPPALRTALARAQPRNGGLLMSAAEPIATLAGVNITYRGQ